MKNVLAQALTGLRVSARGRTVKGGLSGGLCLAAAVVLAWSQPARAQLLIETRFGEDHAPLSIVDQQGDEIRVSGSLPKGWGDNSSWARVWVKYAPMEEEGIKFLRVEVTRAEQGWAQFCHVPLPDIESEAFFRLSVKLRSPGRMPVTLSVRYAGSPYTELWGEMFYPSPARWEERSFVFRAAKNAQPIGFWVRQDGEGLTDYATLRLERIGKDEAQAAIRARYPAPASGNLLRNTRLPLGLQCGWSLSGFVPSSEGDEVEIGPDPQMPGPSGAPALRIRVLKAPVVLFGEPFAPVVAPDKYVASLSLRGTGKCEVQVIGWFASEPDVRVPGIAAFDLGREKVSDWQRFAVPFSPLPLMESYSLRLILRDPGTYWFDALQVEKGETATPYASQMACEVALALPESAASLARVQFDDEPAEVRYAVTGSAAGATLRAKAVNLYGGESALPAVTLKDGFLQAGTLSYQAALKERPYGVFRVEAWVEDGAGARISPFNETVIHRLRRSHYWMTDAPESPFGVHIFSNSRHCTMAKAIGANWVRLHDPGAKITNWYCLEPKPGECAFQDDDLLRYRRHRLKVLGMLQTAPAWASYAEEFKRLRGPNSSAPFDESYCPPKDLDAFARYVRTLVARYKGTIDTYEFWNEPYWSFYWGKCEYGVRPKDDGDPNAVAFANYVRLMQIAYESAKSVDPAVRVLGYCSFITPDKAGAAFSGREWTAGVTAAGGLDYCDVVSFHHYINSFAALGCPGDDVDRGIRVMSGPLVEKFGRVPKDLWMTEGSPLHFTVLPNVGFHNHSLCGKVWAVDPTIPGDRMARYVVSLLAQGVRKVFSYSMHCASGSLLSPMVHYNDLVATDGYLNVAAAAYATVTWHLEDTRPVKAVQLTEGVYADLFEGKGRAVAVLCTAPANRRKPYRLPALEGASVADLFGNPLPATTSVDETVVYVSVPTDASDLEKRLLGGGRAE